MARHRGARAALAALLLASPAAALDLQKAVPTLEPCPGRAGFVRTPGSRNCTRVSGRVAAGIDARTGHDGAAFLPRAAGRIAIDNRTDTDLGEVRTYLRIDGRR
ncbi:hypothetical protein Q8W71_08310 [Methylobacterium sp. NEAU 140]|uniref:hypothetical protein n=1 Tax=Methylobacterium sp. NEAU 140 TaxID=3064945 RepID=UPI0027356A54|nr:hypothetical protein [Methylobacterium sp. NEAU 140]MDP4022621.1 hypothetical protein [Methylobacterium sp. NEAU 140]